MEESADALALMLHAHVMAGRGCVVVLDNDGAPNLAKLEPAAVSPALVLAELLVSTGCAVWYVTSDAHGAWVASGSEGAVLHVVQLKGTAAVWQCQRSQSACTNKRAVFPQCDTCPGCGGPTRANVYLGDEDEGYVDCMLAKMQGFTSWVRRHQGALLYIEPALGVAPDDPVLAQLLQLKDWPLLRTPRDSLPALIREYQLLPPPVGMEGRSNSDEGGSALSALPIAMHMEVLDADGRSLYACICAHCSQDIADRSPRLHCLDCTAAFDLCISCASAASSVARCRALACRGAGNSRLLTPRRG
jgi:hypothetical protein